MCDVVCPLEGVVAVDPVVDFECNTYSQAAIAAWIDAFGTSPVTGSPLSHRQVAAWHAVARDGIKPTERDVDMFFRSSVCVLTPSPDRKEPRVRKRKAEAPAVQPHKRSRLTLCGRTSCLWCPQCALSTIAKVSPPGLWPSDIYNAVFWPHDTPPPTFNHRMRVRAGYFFYANGAWQDKDLFYNLMKPRLSPHVTRYDIDKLFEACETKQRLYTTTDVNLGMPGIGDKVSVDGRVTSSDKFACSMSRKLTNWDRHTTWLLSCKLAMPSYSTCESFFSSANRVTDARAYCDAFKE